MRKTYGFRSEREREREREGFTRARLRRQKVDFIHLCKTLEGAETEWGKNIFFVYISIINGNTLQARAFGLVV